MHVLRADLDAGVRERRLDLAHGGERRDDEGLDALDRSPRTKAASASAKASASASVLFIFQLVPTQSCGHSASSAEFLSTMLQAHAGVARARCDDRRPAPRRSATASNVVELGQEMQRRTAELAVVDQEIARGRPTAIISRLDCTTSWSWWKADAPWIAEEERKATSARSERSASSRDDAEKAVELPAEYWPPSAMRLMPAAPASALMTSGCW